jgi:hypothetical protein
MGPLSYLPISASDIFQYILSDRDNRTNNDDKTDVTKGKSKK